MIIACATDRRFTQLAGVMLASLFANGEIGDWRVVVFGYRLQPQDKAMLRASCGANAERIEIVDVDPRSPFLNGLMPTRFALSPAPYLRLLIPPLLGKEDGRLLYLDADTLVLSSLRPLAELDLEGRAVAAARDHISTHPSRMSLLPFPPDRPHLNSGVLVIDIERWRALDLTRRAFEFVETHEGAIAFPDQDALNCILDGGWKMLEPEWNVTHHNALDVGHCDHARIAHFTGGKPWSADCGHPARELFLQYRATTPWRDKRLSTRFERRMRKMARKRLMRFKRWWMGRLPGYRPLSAPGG